MSRVYVQILTSTGITCKEQILIIPYVSCFISATLPGMWERTVTIGSAGKTFSVTGWKVKDLALHNFPAHTDKASQRDMVPRCIFLVQKLLAL